jgi:hypothetical protein
VALARIADRRHAAFVGRELFGGRVPRAQQDGEADHHRGEANAEDDHDHYAKPAVHERLEMEESEGLVLHAATVPCRACEEFPKPVHAIEPAVKRQLHETRA